MNYNINPACLTSAFTVPATVVDSHLKFVKPEHLKVLLYIMRNMLRDVADSEIAAATDLSEYDVKEALLYWADAGLLCPKETTPAVPVKEEKKKTVSRVQKPTRNDVARRGNDDPKIGYLLRETEQKFARPLKTNEQQTLVWLYDDNGLDVSLILYIVQYAVQREKANIKFIESIALDWIDKGIDNLTDADNEVRNMAICEKAWSIVSSAFGLERRKPSKKETEHSVKWIEEWGFSRDMLIAAYEECVNQKSKFSFPYVAKILENWHEKGYKNPSDIISNKNTSEKSDMVTFDLGLYQKMLDSEDQ